MKRSALIILLIACLGIIFNAQARRRVSPVETPATMTRAVNETAKDTARINARRKANSINYVDDKGHTVYIDTLSGEKWEDSTVYAIVPKMEYPLWHSVTLGLNLWDPMMRIFGQKYGVTDISARLSLHNRYIPVVDFGLGYAKASPAGDNYTYTSPLSTFFRLGCEYNFLYNSDPAYLVTASAKYGFSAFDYSVDNVTVHNDYWQESSSFNIPTQNARTGWLEVAFGVRVQLVGPLSAGWNIKYQSILHESKNTYGAPWYIPGFGSRNSSVSGAVSLFYTFSLDRPNKKEPDNVTTETSPSVNTPQQ